MNKRVVVICVFAGFVLLAWGLAWMLWDMGRSGESQFSPDTFQFRGVTYHYLVWTDSLLFTVEGAPSSAYGPLLKYWIEEGYFTPPPHPPKRWDVLTGWRSGRKGSWHGEASGFWYTGLCYSDAEQGDWIAWSRKHPQLAKRLWPEVVRLLKEAKYDLAGWLMLVVWDTHDDETLFDRAFHDWQVDSGQIKK
jgi:hypothetical protein